MSASQKPTFNPANNTQTSQNTFQPVPPPTFTFDPSDSTQVFHNNFTPPPQGQDTGNSTQVNRPQWDPQRNTWYKRDKYGRKVRLNNNDGHADTKAKIPKLNGIDSIPEIFSNDYKPPETILTAIKKISKGTSKSSGGDTEKSVSPLKVTQSCNSILHDAVESGELIPENYPNMTIEEAKTITSYTYNGNNNIETSPFKEVNNILRRGNPNEIRGSIDMIYMLLKSFRKIKPEQHKILYRGIKAELVEGKLRGTDGNLFQPEDVYEKGNFVTFYPLTSTSTSRLSIKDFLIENKIGRSVVYIIHNGEGYNVAPFSMFPSEKEVVMDIESTFKVLDVRNEYWDFDIIEKEENGPKDITRGSNGHKTTHRVDKDGENVCSVTVIEMEYIKPDRLSFQDHIDTMIKKESDKTIPMIDAYKRFKAPHAESRKEDEYTTQATNTGESVRLNMRTGEMVYFRSTIGLPKGWVEMTETVEGVEDTVITYYTDGKVKQYERPQMDKPYKF